MAGHEYGAAVGGQRFHQGADPQNPFWIQPVDRFVEHHDARVAEQRGGYTQPLAHAERESPGPFPGHFREADEAEHLIHPALRNVVGLRQAAQVIAGTAATMHRPGIQQCAHLAHGAGQLRVRLTVYGDGSGAGIVEAEDQPHGRGLSRAIRAEKTCYQARPDREAEPIDRDGRTKTLGKPICLNHRAFSLTAWLRQQSRYGDAAIGGSRPPPNFIWVFSPALYLPCASGGAIPASFHRRSVARSSLPRAGQSSRRRAPFGAKGQRRPMPTCRMMPAR